MNENAYDLMRRAVNEANFVNKAANDAADTFAYLAKGRLRYVSHGTLKALKLELRNYNIHTGEWK